VDSEQFNILLVDDDPTVIRILSKVLGIFTPMRFATSGQDALRLAEQSPPDLMIIDVEMPGMSGLEVCKAIKKNLLLQNVPVMLMSSHSSAQLESYATEFDVCEFVQKPPNPALLLSKVRHQQQQKKLLSDTIRGLSPVDFLTGAASQRHFRKAIRTEWQHGIDEHTPLSLMLASIDHFAAYNDAYGEAAGDICLRATAGLLRTLIHRPDDQLGRYSGSTFGLLLPQTPVSGACHLARRASQRVSEMTIDDVTEAARKISLSIGISANYLPIDNTWSADNDEQVQVLQHVDADELCVTAEQALQIARKTSGNCVVFQGIGRSAERMSISR
jgi:diguanylate cyclase (GGDEF)-like protein